MNGWGVHIFPFINLLFILIFYGILWIRWVDTEEALSDAACTEVVISAEIKAAGAADKIRLTKGFRTDDMAILKTFLPYPLSYSDGFSISPGAREISYSDVDKFRRRAKYV